MTISTLGLLLSAAAALSCAARMAFLFARRTPVRGTVTRHDYDPTLRRFESELSWSDPILDPWNGSPFRKVWTRVTYLYGGTEYRNDVEVTVFKGTNPDMIVRLWLDPSDPNRVTAYGPAYWFVGVIAAFTFGILFGKLPF